MTENTKDMEKKKKSLRDRDFLRKGEAMEYLGIGSRKLNAMLDDGLPFYAVDSRTIWISKQDIKEYLEKFKVQRNV